MEKKQRGSEFLSAAPPVRAFVTPPAQPVQTKKEESDEDDFDIEEEVVKEESSVQSHSSFTSSLESEDIYEKGENIAKDFIIHNKKKAELMRRQGFMKRTTTKNIQEAHDLE